jgi:ribosome-binding factor A
LRDIARPLAGINREKLMARHGRAPSQRQLRVGEELRHALAELFARHDLRDPDLADLTITVTEVRASPDLRQATAYVLALGGGEEEQELLRRGLGRSAGYLRTQLAKQVHLKFSPRLVFEIDRSFDAVAHLDSLLQRPEAGDES